LEDPGIDGRTILKERLKKQGVGMPFRLIWLKRGTNCKDL